MSMTEIVKMFGERKVRSIWDDVAEKWYFSVVDVVSVLTGSDNPRNYWKVLKNRLKKEGNQSVTNCNQLKLKASDGKSYKTDVADQEQLFRIIQSIPSPNAEPFKVWMAKVAADLVGNKAEDDHGSQSRSQKWRWCRTNGAGGDREEDGTQGHLSAERGRHGCLGCRRGTVSASWTAMTIDD